MDSYFSLFLSIWGFNSSQNSGVSLSHHLALSLGHFIPCWRNSFREPSALFQSWGAIFDQKTAKVGTGVPQESQQPPPLPDWETYVLPTVSSKRRGRGFEICVWFFSMLLDSLASAVDKTFMWLSVVKMLIPLSPVLATLLLLLPEDVCASRADKFQSCFSSVITF